MTLGMNYSNSDRLRVRAAVSDSDSENEEESEGGSGGVCDACDLERTHFRTCEGTMQHSTTLRTKVGREHKRHE